MYTLSLAVSHRHPAVMNLPVGQGAREDEPENQPGFIHESENQPGFIHESEPEPELEAKPEPEAEDQLDPGVASVGSEPTEFDEQMSTIHPFYALLLACGAEMEEMES
jgi:hypothetical protein